MAEISDKLSVYTLGRTGVIIDQNPLEPTVPNDSLKLAQNAMHDPTMGYGGGIRKRPGLQRFNSQFAGGAILGGIPMPVAETGGAPASGGGAIVGTGDTGFGGGIVGDSSGTGDMTGAPGATFDGGAATTTPAGAGAFTASTLFSGARLIAVGRNNLASSNNGGAGWYLTSKNFADLGVLTTIPQAPCEVYSYPTFVAPNPAGLQGQPSCIGLDGRLYYAAEHGNQSTGGTLNGTLPIYVTNGGVASLLATIPKNTYSNAIATGTTVRAGVMGMHTGTDGFLYLAIKDKFTGQDTAGSCGRIFRLRPTTGELVEWNTGAAGSVPVVFTSVPYCVNYFNGYLFMGDAPHVDAGACQIIASNGTEGVVDRAIVGTDSNNVTMMCQFNGRLFAGCGVSKAAGTGLAKLFSRGPGSVGSGLDWTAQTFDASRTGSTTNGNSYASMVVYDATTAFLSWHAPSSKSIIYKVVANNPGDETSTSFTFTSAFDSGAGTTGPLNLYLDQNVLYAIAEADGGGTIAWVSTDGGTSWTDRSAKFPTTGTAFAMPIFFAMDQ